MTDRDPNVVELSPICMLISGIVGVSRHVKLVNKAEGYNGIDNRKRGWQDNCDGATGEQAFAKWLDVFWDGTVGTFRDVPDVGQYEVRTNAWDRGDLILREKDKADSTIYVLVLSHDCPEFTIKGWITGAAGRQDQWWRVGDPKRPPAWFVPQSALHSMETLPR